MPLAFFVCMAIWSGFRYFAATETTQDHGFISSISSALWRFSTKGLIGIVFPFGVVIIWLIISRRWRETFALFSPIGILLFAAIAMPWLILVQQANPDFFRFFFIQEHLLRYATRMHDRYQPILLLSPHHPGRDASLVRLSAGGVPGYPEEGRDALFGGVEKRFLLVWIGLILIFFSISSSKLIPYIAPIFLPIALIFGHLFRRYEDEPDTADADSRPASLPSDGDPAIASLHGRSDWPRFSFASIGLTRESGGPGSPSPFSSRS